MANALWVKETWINETEDYMIGESEWYETRYSVNELGDLYRSCVKEYGGCVGKVYVDTPDGNADAIGWVFQKNRKYEDVNKNYLASCWVVYRQQKDNFKGK